MHYESKGKKQEVVFTQRFMNCKLLLAQDLLLSRMNLCSNQIHLFKSFHGEELKPRKEGGDTAAMRLLREIVTLVYSLCYHYPLLCCV